jgi:hypothetical protein
VACGASGSRRPWIAVLGTELSTPGRAGLRPTGRSRAQPWHISSSAAMVDQKGRACIGAPDIRRTKPRHDVNADKRGNRYPVRLGGSSKGAALSFSRKRVVSSGRTMAGGRLVAASRRGGAGTALCQGTPAASCTSPRQEYLGEALAYLTASAVRLRLRWFGWMGQGGSILHRRQHVAG